MSEKQAIRAALARRAEEIRNINLVDMFDSDSKRCDRYSVRLETMLVDYSRNRVDKTAIELLLELAGACNLAEKIEGLFRGDTLNTTEQRPARHTLLRASAPGHLAAEDEPVLSQVKTGMQQMYDFVEQLGNGAVKGATGKPVDKLVNIGIGGSDLGPRLVCEALAAHATNGINVEFVANIDPADLHRVLKTSDPETTMFVLVSKSFTTRETLVNAGRARQWLLASGCPDTGRHFLAVSVNADAVAAFGIPDDRLLRIWDWVGGRYSVWSCAGLAACAAIGSDNFAAFLDGAETMDRHFRDTQLAENLPVLLGLLSVWNNNLLGYSAHAVIPYDQGLRLLPDYLSQLVMESNGKSVTNNGNHCEHDTAPVIWGGVGTNAQHAFFQALHQGTVRTTVDFIVAARSAVDNGQHRLLLANCLAQGMALMHGRPDTEQAYRHIPGNRPSTTIMISEVDPFNLGMLLALYEHKTFTEAVIWDINPFDQWGVELGKTLAHNMETALADPGQDAGMDSTCRNLLDFYRECSGE